jgi:hypothetical protein
MKEPLKGTGFWYGERLILDSFQTQGQDSGRMFPEYVQTVKKYACGYD